MQGTHRRLIWHSLLIALLCPVASAIFVLFSPIPCRAATQSRGPETKDSDAGQGRRLALVIGNGEYAGMQLFDSVDNATEVADALERAGFRGNVRRVFNARRDEMGRTVHEFLASIHQGDLVFVYYSGHAGEVEGTNYLLPIDLPADSSAEDVEAEAVSVQRVTQELDARGAAVKVVVLDSCRNNTFKTSGSAGGGLAPMDSVVGVNSMIVFSTAAGRTVSESNSGRNDLFTQYLLRELKAVGVSLDDAMRDLSRQMASDTHGQQVPAVYSRLEKPVYLLTGTNRGDAASAPPAREVDDRHSADPKENEWDMMGHRSREDEEKTKEAARELTTPGQHTGNPTPQRGSSPSSASASSALDADSGGSEHQMTSEQQTGSSPLVGGSSAISASAASARDAQKVDKEAVLAAAAKEQPEAQMEAAVHAQQRAIASHDDEYHPMEKPPEEQISSNSAAPDQIVRPGLDRPAPAPNELPMVQVESYPNIEAPNNVTPDQEFAVQVSLTDEPLTTETRIQTGAQHDGRLVVQMGDLSEIPLTVVLSAPGFDFSKGSNSQEILLEKDGNSSVAAFFLRPHPGPNGEAAAPRETRILASLFHKDAFIARLTRPITIGSVSQPALPVRAEAGAATSTSESGPELRGANLSGQKPLAKDSLTAKAPDMTVMENRVGNLLVLNFHIGDRDYPASIADAQTLHTWIDGHLAQMARHARGFDTTADDASTTVSAGDYLTGFGNELFDRVVPDTIKGAFARAVASGNLRTLQVLSDDPSIPWELMRPLVPGAKVRGDFLGERVAVARWPMMAKGLQRPPQTLQVSESVVVAPQYSGKLSLANTAGERDMVLRTPTFAPADGSYAAMRLIATHPPRGFVHFAGHGTVRQLNGLPQYAILLKDGEIVPEAWASLQQDDSAEGTLYFFNACEVGGSGQFMNEVDGWAPALLSGGASGYIGALWAISDDTASRFATTFYDALALAMKTPGGVNLAAIVTATRRHVFAETHDPTALAYVFYGDPQMRVMPDAIARAKKKPLPTLNPF